MLEKASRHTADAVLIHVADPTTSHPSVVTAWEDLSDQYQEEFMPVAAEMYSRGVPRSQADLLLGCGWMHAQLAISTIVRIPCVYQPPPHQEVVTQLLNKEVGRFLYKGSLATFAQAPALAQTKTTTNVTFKGGRLSTPFNC
jgi:hypothetical protein